MCKSGILHFLDENHHTTCSKPLLSTNAKKVTVSVLYWYEKLPVTWVTNFWNPKGWNTKKKKKKREFVLKRSVFHSIGRDRVGHVVWRWRRRQSSDEFRWSNSLYDRCGTTPHVFSIAGISSVRKEPVYFSNSCRGRNSDRITLEFMVKPRPTKTLVQQNSVKKKLHEGRLWTKLSLFFVFSL